MASSLEREIHEQPEVLHRLVAEQMATVRRVVDRLRRRPPRFLVIAARGTSDNAAVYAKYAFTVYNRVPVVLAAPSIITLYDSPPDMSESLVLGISQSGTGLDVCAVVEAGKTQGAQTLAITNDGGSSLAQVADDVILLEAGEEKSVAATKTYTTELTAIAMLTACWTGSDEMLSELSALPGWAEQALARQPEAQAIAASLVDEHQLLVVGRGYNFATALEIALKLKELAYVLAHPYSAADVRHGPIAIVDKGFPVLLIAPAGKAFADLSALASELLARGACVAVITNDAGLLARCPLGACLPAVPEWLSPIIGVIPGQLVAFHLAKLKGYDLDHPRGLRKVTITV
jgi:glucosamine--fructose-6-phosphate aminotransferase (isomerizing)